MNWLITAVIALAALLIGAFAGYRYNKSMIESKIGRTEEYAKKLLDDTTRKADEKKKEMILEAKEEVLRQKSELDKEINDFMVGIDSALSVSNALTEIEVSY